MGLGLGWGVFKQITRDNKKNPINVLEQLKFFMVA
jgi:hypothetical protein